ncbi:MAG: TonB-dependent receptor [Microscillaceae bacterium]|jgi:iron complex outermembrane receptor protein|nr:TonB-dependent receptor [Microscillaceae bacterium]
MKIFKTRWQFITNYSPPSIVGRVVNFACYLFLTSLLSSICVTAFAQFSISGKVSDQSSGEVLTGANVYLENTWQAAASDWRGFYKLAPVKPGNYTLKVSFVGYDTFTQVIEIADNQEINIQLKASNFIADEVVVRATRATDNTGMAFSNLEKKDLAKQNLGQDLPILLNFTPSVVTTSDAGAGVGYTGIRIRGSDPTRTNVTINGIPLNDAESQGVFWVNMPDFASSVASIQIQRGVGTSTNGAGAFGATMNLQTNQMNSEAYAEVNNSYGSFNTWKHTAMLGTGLLKGKFTLDGRISRITSDGFIDRASSELKSFYVSGGYYGKKSMVRLNVFSGAERTYQAWNGVPEARLRGDREGMQDFIARNGLDNADAQNLLNSDSRTYNFYTYDNQVDNYQQDHYQFFYNLEITKKWNLNTALHYTRGRGYFEEYRKNDDLADYGIAPVVIDNQTISQSDLIRRRWLDNHFFGAVYSLNYTGNRWQLTWGGGWNRYLGGHFGEVIWARFASNSEIRQRYYDNDAQKNDFNSYFKAFYQFNTQLTGFVDLQYRHIQYAFVGKAVDSFGARDVGQTANLIFFNPKIGLNYQINAQHSLYTSWSVAHREPNRDDFTQSTAQSRPQAERLQDWELGYRFQSAKLAFQANYYWMNYKNQLVLTGEVNDVGAYIRGNIDRSYRMGLELELRYKITKNLDWNINTTISRNKIQNFKEFVDNYDANFDYLGQASNQFQDSDIAFSPNWIAGSQLEYQAGKNFSVALLSKYVSKQYLDNTQNENRRLDAFFTQDIRLTYQIKPKFLEQINLSLLVNNILNEKYESNGYTFGYLVDNQRITENFYYPQAGTNFLLAVGLRF